MHLLPQFFFYFFFFYVEKKNKTQKEQKHAYGKQSTIYSSSM
jgi:hypothetical protein